MRGFITLIIAMQAGIIGWLVYSGTENLPIALAASVGFFVILKDIDGIRNRND